MSSQLRIDQAEAALIAMLEAKMQAAYGSPVQVDSLGDKDFDDDGTLILQPPAIRVRYTGTKFASLRDNSGLTYMAEHVWEVLCFESSLRSKEDERAQTLALVAVALNQLAGARLQLADGSTTPPVKLEGVSLVIAPGAADQSFGISIVVGGPAQFDGPNA